MAIFSYRSSLSIKCKYKILNRYLIDTPQDLHFSTCNEIVKYFEEIRQDEEEQLQENRRKTMLKKDNEMKSV